MKSDKASQDLDEENKALKRILTTKNSELEYSRLMYAETASRLSQAEILLRKISENQRSMELARCYPTSNELPLMSNYDIYSDDEAISSGSWANVHLTKKGLAHVIFYFLLPPFSGRKWLMLSPHRLHYS